MEELSQNILDIAQNSLAAGAENVEITLTETEETLTVTINDDGRGMDAETQRSIFDPFYTTRKTRNVGLGIPFFAEAARQTGGDVQITGARSNGKAGRGTCITALFYKTSIDFLPLGDIAATLLAIIHGLNGANLIYSHVLPGKKIDFDTREIASVLGAVPMDEPEVLLWIKSRLDALYEKTP